MKQAFILGAGLGTRLRPLTDHLPKPLVPLFHRPLAEWAVKACTDAGIRRIAINTHHLPETWHDFRPQGVEDITFFHEPVLLETGGGLKNIAEWTKGEPLLVHNGDVFSTLPLGRLVSAHKASGLPVTLALVPNGDAKFIALDASGSKVLDIRHKLGKAPGTHVFTGIYCVNSEFLTSLPEGNRKSVTPYFIALASEGKLGAISLNEGIWLDLGDRTSYLQAHTQLDLAEKIHPGAVVEAGAIVENSVIGAGAIVESGVIVRNSVVWAGNRIHSGSVLDSCIVCSGKPVTGHHENKDL